jgi:GT2 family glycosyltransferase
MKIGIVIPCYNSRELLEKYFPSVREIARMHSAEIIVVDDASADTGVDYLRRFPDVRLYQNDENLGFIKTVNKGVANSPADIVFLLNTDIEARSDFIAPVLPHFDDDEVFAVSLKALNPDGSFREGAKRVVFRFGFPRVLHNEKDQPPPVGGIHYTDYPVGGHCAVRKSMFDRLGGFDEIYSPFYWEDTDLGYRARARGWKIIYEPGSEVYHHHQGVIRSTYKEQRIRTVKIRNRIIFARRHGSGTDRLLLKISTLFRLVGSWFSGDKAFRDGCRSAKNIYIDKNF